jgi:hypothetical protein
VEEKNGWEWREKEREREPFFFKPSSSLLSFLLYNLSVHPLGFCRGKLLVFAVVHVVKRYSG